jgi:hypothetical protein
VGLAEYDREAKNPRRMTNETNQSPAIKFQHSFADGRIMVHHCKDWIPIIWHFLYNFGISHVGYQICPGESMPTKVSSQNPNWKGFVGPFPPGINADIGFAILGQCPGEKPLSVPSRISNLANLVASLKRTLLLNQNLFPKSKRELQEIQ